MSRDTLKNAIVQIVSIIWHLALIECFLSLGFSVWLDSFSMFQASWDTSLEWTQHIFRKFGTPLFCGTLKLLCGEKSPGEPLTYDPRFAIVVQPTKPLATTLRVLNWWSAGHIIFAAVSIVFIFCTYLQKKNKENKLQILFSD